MDLDSSDGLDMMEMTELFDENGIKMTTEEIAEMFSIVAKINKRQIDKSAIQALKNGHSGFIQNDLAGQTIEEKLKIILSRSDFRMITENIEALRCK